jgi:exodeoxyribonuclease VII large subunit
MSNADEIFTVTELTRRIRYALEDRFSALVVEGEISNYYPSPAGHVYFTLKDAGSQIKTVFFKGSQRGHKAPLKNGLKVRVHGEISVYEKGGNYQVIARRVEAAGKGDLHAQFEALKLKLTEEGLFAADRKQPLPFLPQHVAVVTSPRGAAVRDFLNVVSRRYPNLHILIFPVRVQGDGAAAEIAKAIKAANERGGFDVIVVTRGGGSVEDLWSFNEEVVARAIAASELPVLSAVGHEVDFSIADFVADFRAATPSAAAELLVGRKDAFESQLQQVTQRMAGGLRNHVLQFKNRLLRASTHPAMREPATMVREYRQRLDALTRRMESGLSRDVQSARHELSSQSRQLETALQQSVQRRRAHIEKRQAGLQALSPVAVLERGYSITYDAQGGIVRSTESVKAGDQLQTQVSDGSIASKVVEPATKK